MNSEISKFFGKLLLINSLQCPNNYNMVEYIIGEQLMKFNQQEIENNQNDMKEFNNDDVYQSIINNQNSSHLKSNHYQQDEKQSTFEYIDYKIEEKLNEPQQESAILDSIPIEKNEIDFQSQYGVDQFNTFVETNFLSNYKFILRQHLDSKNNSYQIRTSIQPY
ncbi:unnamed protein product (macronuclear) [Paramecium tetraurelia]|uniref:Uncharacterized protein n=1 Tax=Paramecium tetraurelia TaxID=5888 RepID=A0BNK3_PARTE|nr:uncharacterized protein GSPATT00030758001 [Paramecium tetraurelia]CAK60120.1 unnamed protein product [Paramecium tetraurelia]|eukprot:XP_001427518.1 hypothetical protein (macronuclear) [Paramecium tetraurelia strain d4-2]